jgi:DNA-binding MarR family transcriptional regulator
MERQPYALLARVRRALRVLNRAIESASRGSGLTVQQQAFLLALEAHAEDLVPLAEVRAELDMDQPTSSELLARLHTMGLVRRSRGRDRRATLVALSAKGKLRLQDSIGRTRNELMRAARRGDLDAWSDSLASYLDFYTGASRRRRARGIAERTPTRGRATTEQRRRGRHREPT